LNFINIIFIMSNKNHFIIGYKGNKREEIKYIIKDIDFTNIKYIVEPFCGSSALSYHLSLLYPNKFKYILNDNNNNLIKLYNIMKDPKKILFFKVMIELLMKNINKIKYLNLVDDVYKYYIHHKIYKIMPGLFPNDNRKYNLNLKGPIINFLQNEKVKIYNIDAIDIYDKYKNKKNALIFLDPPYLFNTAIGEYGKQCNYNIYEHVYYNKMENENAIILFCIEKNWMIDLLFNKFKIIKYNKTYRNKNRKTTHIIINNKITI